MKMKSAIAGAIIATSILAAGASQACFVRSLPACATCTTVEGFVGKGWHMVPCGTCIPPAPTWQLYVSGGYAPPVVTERPVLFLGY